ncbi:MAG: hypothetical protein EHM83_15645 [Burkholderiales bacterium]|nr:MAG: hypothetical protein EHM83_15645 [Burkholderiales bacterium]
MIQPIRLWLIDRRIDLRHAWLVLRRQLSASRLIAATLVAAGLWQLGIGLYLHARGRLAQEPADQPWQQERSADSAVTPIVDRPG